MNRQVKNSKRIIAYLLDICLIYFFMILVTNIKFINPNFAKLENISTSYSKVLDDYSNGVITEDELVSANNKYIYDATKYSVSTNIAIIIVIFAYFGLFQKYNNGQTLGKKIMKIRVIGTDDNEVSLGRYFLRLLPIYYIFIGNILAILLNSFLVFILDSESFIVVNSIIIYTVFFSAIISLVMINNRNDKRSIHDLIAKTKVIEE